MKDGKPAVYKIRNSPPGTIYIGRGSPWGNPFVIGKDGDRSEVIRKFQTYANGRLLTELDWLAPLRGKDLGCFCTPSPCHGDVLLLLAN